MHFGIFEKITISSYARNYTPVEKSFRWMIVLHIWQKTSYFSFFWNQIQIGGSTAVEFSLKSLILESNSMSDVFFGWFYLQMNEI